MKKFIVIILATTFLTMLYTAVPSAQQNSPFGAAQHQAVSEYYQNAVAHAKALYWQARTLSDGYMIHQDVAKEHVAEIEKNLEQLNNRSPGRYQQATVYAQALQEEIAQEQPNKQRVMDLASGVYRALDKAKAAHSENREKRSVPWYETWRNNPFEKG